MPNSSTIFVARQSFTTSIDGEKVVVQKGNTRVRDGHPLLEGREHLFQPLDTAVDHEQATDNPSQRRGGPHEGDLAAKRALEAQHATEERERQEAEARDRQSAEDAERERQAAAEAERRAAEKAAADATAVPYVRRSPEDLAVLAAARGLQVTGTGTNGKVLKPDLVKAHEAFDAAQGQSE